jgi:AcrR family transcriptional regulator
MGSAAMATRARSQRVAAVAPPRRIARTPGLKGIGEIQRARLLGAAARVVSEQGYVGMSVARVTAHAGVSRRTFYELFDDREDCFLALLDDALARATRVAHDAVTPVTVSGQAGWRERIRAGLYALLRFAEEEPTLGSLLVADALGGGPRVLESRARALDTLKHVVDEGRAHTRAGHDPPPLTAEGVIGAVLSVIHARLPARISPPPANGSRARSQRRSAALTELLNPLMGMIVLPYLGQSAAAKELNRPAPTPDHRSDSSHARGTSTRATTMTPSADPLAGLDMRLTHRTLLVLTAIATQPGASNRQIADTAGVHDQGQISKLLNRLERIGLIHNNGQGQPRGEPNAWTLTPRGTEIETALRL